MKEYGLVPREVMLKLSGLELMQGLIAGEYPWPPIMKALDFSLDRVEHGVAVFSGVGKFDHYNPIGSVHGGWIATLLDSCMGC
ncbi:MAG: PaaI family thioesterase, partial [Opitutaceae bacterium]